MKIIYEKEKGEKISDKAKMRFHTKELIRVISRHSRYLSGLLGIWLAQVQVPLGISSINTDWVQVTETLKCRSHSGLQVPSINTDWRLEDSFVNTWVLLTLKCRLLIRPRIFFQSDGKAWYSVQGFSLTHTAHVNQQRRTPRFTVSRPYLMQGSRSL